MEITDQDMDRTADPSTDPIGDPTGDPSPTAPAPGGSSGSGPLDSNGERASDFYDADRPPFEELPEKPRKSPTPGAATVPLDAEPPMKRQARARVGAAAFVTLLALLLLRHRRRRRPQTPGRNRRRARPQRRSHFESALRVVSS